MFRMIRRAPWVALGAAGAYYLDGAQGPSRRAHSAAVVREWMRRGADRWSPACADATGEPTEAELPLTPSVGADRVRSRAEQPLAEEETAGVSEPAAAAMAEQILEESEARVTDRIGTASEHRRSEDTVEPQAVAGGA